MLTLKQFSRGWTFQERLFSRRQLLFQQQMVRWECLCCVWHEVADARDSVSAFDALHLRHLNAVPGQEMMQTYAMAVRSYASATLVTFYHKMLTEDASEYTQSHLPRRWPFSLPWSATSPDPLLPARVFLGASDFQVPLRPTLATKRRAYSEAAKGCLVIPTAQLVMGRLAGCYRHRTLLHRRAAEATVLLAHLAGVEHVRDRRAITHKLGLS